MLVDEVVSRVASRRDRPRHGFRSTSLVTDATINHHFSLWVPVWSVHRPAGSVL